MNYKIDWQQQWKDHALNFRNGKAHIDLNPYGHDQMIYLLPGPGFGDLSHPTTHLMLTLMMQTSGPVIDVGTGSGVLAIAAASLQATPILGVEIDPLALSHAKENAKENGFEKNISFHLTLTGICLPKESTVLMNMIFQDQKTVFKTTPNLLKHAKAWIISGILKQSKEEYLLFANSHGFALKKEITHQGWMGWFFERP